MRSIPGMGIISSCFHLEDCSIKPGGVWLLPVAMERAVMQKRSLQAGTRHLRREWQRDMSTIGLEWSVRDQTWGPSKVRKGRKGHRVEPTWESDGDYSLTRPLLCARHRARYFLL